MERKRAWITAGVVAVTFTASALAVMANTGLLALSPSERGVGRLTAADITLASSTQVTATTEKPATTVRYEDVYVTMPADNASASTDTPSSSASVAPVRALRTAGPVTKRPSTRTAPEREPNTQDEETHEGEQDDD
jgi:hypothetical protein